MIDGLCKKGMPLPLEAGKLLVQMEEKGCLLDSVEDEQYCAMLESLPT